MYINNSTIIPLNGDLRVSTQTNMPKAKLIATAANLVYRQGWNATGINQILGEAKVPKGSFYYYFQSKEDLGVAIVKYHIDAFEVLYAQTLLNTSQSGKASLVSFFENSVNNFKELGLRWGCPVGSFSNEVADTTEKIAEACRAYMTRFLDVLQQALARGQGDGSITNKADAALLAQQINNIWQGTLLNMKTLRSDQPLHAGTVLVTMLLAG